MPKDSMLALGKNSFKKFIYEELEAANSSLPYQIRIYLADLLHSYISTEKVFESKTEKGCFYEASLADLYGKIHGAAGQREKARLLKKMGDFTLYISGFFRSLVKSRLAHISYYENMGQSAYSCLSDFCGPDFYSSDFYSHEKSNIFKDLSRQFRPIAEILFYIQKKGELRDSKGCLSVYKDYCGQRADAVLERLLKEKKLLP